MVAIYIEPALLVMKIPHTTCFSVFDPLLKLRQHAVLSSGLDAPSLLELPPGTASVKGPPAAGGLRKIWMGLVPLADPASCYQDDNWVGDVVRC